MSMLCQLVFARNQAAHAKFGRLEHPDDGLKAYKEYVRPIDDTVEALCRIQGNSTIYKVVRNWGAQFVSQQLFMHVLAGS